MLIVDAQIHLRQKGTPSAHHHQEPYSAEQAISGMDAARVDRALVHPVLWDPDSNELAVEAVRAYRDRFAIMGWFYLDQPENRALVEGWKERPGMLGLRFYFNERHKESWVTDGTLDWLWPAAERAGVSVSLAAAMFLPTVGKIAERHPGLKLIVDHMGVPRASRGESAYRFQPELLALAKYPNVAVKATGQAGYAEDAYPFRSLHPHLHRCFNVFGPERMFWGTDITRMQCSWRQCVTPRPTCGEPPLFDHLFGALLEMQRCIKTKRLDGLEVDDQLELDRVWTGSSLGCCGLTAKRRSP